MAVSFIYGIPGRDTIISSSTVFWSTIKKAAKERLECKGLVAAHCTSRHYEDELVSEDP